MTARSLCGTTRSLDGLPAVYAIASATARGVVCPPSGPGAAAITPRFGRPYHVTERLAGRRGSDVKDPRKTSAQAGGAGPGP